MQHLLDSIKEKENPKNKYLFTNIALSTNRRVSLRPLILIGTQNTLHLVFTAFVRPPPWHCNLCRLLRLRGRLFSLVIVILSINGNFFRFGDLGIIVCGKVDLFGRPSFA